MQASRLALFRKSTTSCCEDKALGCSLGVLGFEKSRNVQTLNTSGSPEGVPVHTLKDKAPLLETAIAPVFQALPGTSDGLADLAPPSKDGWWPFCFRCCCDFRRVLSSKTPCTSPQVEQQKFFSAHYVVSPPSTKALPVPCCTFLREVQRTNLPVSPPSLLMPLTVPAGWDVPNR